MANKVGRPSKYTPELLEAARAYADGAWESDDRVIPTVVGMALALDVTTETLYEWAQHEDKSEFSYILTRVKNLQHEILVSRGLIGEFNPAITKMMMTKHGYSDKVETDNKHDVSDPLKELLGEIGSGKRTVGGDDD